MSFSPGENIGPYRIIEPLGQGGMASVFKAYHAALDRFVALKVLHPAFREDPNFLARFQREARVVARLEHPNIVPIYDFSEHDGRPFLVMKFIEGETLKARLARGRLSAVEILRVVDSVGAALAYAHRQGILHRDVKPSNVLLANDGQIYLADFGLARIAASGESTLTADQMLGTPQYISPEQAMSKPDLDQRTDIYSFGVMLYEIVVGRVPFNADTPFSVIHDHIYTPLPLPSQLNPQVPPDVERVLLKALAKDPNDRYAEVPTLVQAFHAALENSGGQAFLSSPVIPHAISTAETLPPKQVPAVTPAETLAVPDSTEPNEIPNPPAPPLVTGQTPLKPNKPRWTGGIIALTIVLLLACGLILLNNLVRLQPGSAATQRALVKTTQTINQTITAQVAATQIPVEASAVPAAETPQPGLEAVKPALDAAIAAWQANDLQTADAQLLAGYQLSSKNANYASIAIPYLNRSGAWLLSASIIFSSYAQRPDESNLANAQKVHEILYKAAKDPLAIGFMKDHANDPFFTAAQVRMEIYFGDPNSAKKMLAEDQGRPVVNKRFPELDLAQVELSIQMKNLDRARQELNAVAAKTDYPNWIKDFILQLEKLLSN